MLRASMTHEAAFYVSLAFSVFFYWGLGGGKLVWSIMFACLGLVIDFTKRSELELSCFEKNFWIRNRRRFFALILTMVSILAALSASLTRAASVARIETAITNTDSIETKIANAKESVAIWQGVLRELPFNYATEREKAANRLKAATDELDSAQAKLDEKSLASAGKELRIDTFAELANFFGVTNYQVFMVILLMVGAIGAELSFWLTLTPHWRNLPEPEAIKEFAPAPDDSDRGRTLQTMTLRAGVIKGDNLDPVRLDATEKEAPPVKAKIDPRVDTLF